MYKCMYECVWPGKHECLSICMSVSVMQESPCMYVYVTDMHRGMCMYICIYVCMYICICRLPYISVGMKAHAYIFVCMNVYKHI